MIFFSFLLYIGTLLTTSHLRVSKNKHIGNIEVNVRWHDNDGQNLSGTKIAKAP